MMGRYLLEMESEERLLKRARTPERRAQIAYYVGLKAQSEGRYADAVDWYRVVFETGQDKKYEHGFVLNTLGMWIDDGRSLDVLGK